MTEQLHSIFREWAAADPKRLEWVAACRDFEALNRNAPNDLNGLRRQIAPHGDALIDLARSLHHLCSRSFLPQLLSMRSAP